VKNLYLSETQEESKHVWEWVRSIYFLSIKQFLDSKMLEISNNMTPYKRDNEIITQLHIINQLMDQMANKFRDRLDTLERQHVNDHDRVQIRLEQREFNIRRVVRRVNTNVYEFVADNMDISDVDFKDVLDNNRIVSL